AWAARVGATRTETRRRADEHASRRSVEYREAATGEDDPAHAVERSARVGILGRARAHSRARHSRHRGRFRSRERSVRALRRHHRSAARSDEVTFEGLEPSILWPALIAGLLVLATHVPLGREVLARGIIFIDLAVAQV